MATERQIAANRRNASRSTGPRSGAGKKRASRSSYRHGFSAWIAPGAGRAKRIEQLARQIAGDAADVLSLEWARSAAQAEFDLADARQAKVALIERLQTDGGCDGPASAPTPLQAGGWREVSQAASIFAKLDKTDFFIDGWPYEEAGSSAKLDKAGFFSEPGKAGTSKPSARPKRPRIAARQRLSELLKLDRYERRTIGRRQRPLRALSKREDV
jgi:hypothetical protein